MKQMKFLFTILAFFLFAVELSAQDKMLVKRIYVFDVTKSMIGEGKINGKYGTPKVFSQLKDDLVSTITGSSICDDDEIVIIPFTNTTFDKIMGYGRDRNRIADEVKNLTTKSGDTNIVDAWLAGLKEIDQNKINLLFLMTDGIHNCGPDVNELYRSLEQWDDNANNLAFYFMLTKNAESDKIDSIAKNKATMEIVHSSDIKINILQLSSNYKVNVKGNNNYEGIINARSGSCNPTELKHVTMQMVDTTNYYIADSQIFTDKIILTLSTHKDKNSLPISSQNTITFTWNDNKGDNTKTYIMPKTITLQIDNLDTRTMKIY